LNKYHSLASLKRGQEIEMQLQVNSKLCCGCGSCINICSVGAIHMADHLAVMDHDLCVICESCLDACPNSAITMISLPVRRAPTLAQPAPQTVITPAVNPTGLPEIVSTKRSPSPVTGAAMAFLGSEVAVRLVDLVITALERRLVRSEMTVTSPLSAPSPSTRGGSAGIRRQIRYRGGRSANGNPEQRR
jgi:ferredoxin